MLKVRDIMTREVISLSPESTIRDAMEVLAANHLSGAPVTSGEGVVGVVSMTDIVAFIIDISDTSSRDQVEPGIRTFDGIEEVEEDDEEEIRQLRLAEDMWDDWSKPANKPASAFAAPGEVFTELTSSLDTETVKDIMNAKVISVGPDESVKAAASAMRKHGIHRVVVMDGKSLAGIVSSMDVARAVSTGGMVERK